MAVGFNSHTLITGSASSTGSQSFNCGAGANFLVVFVAVRATIAGETCTFNGVSMTELPGMPINASGVVYETAFYLVNPAPGTNALSVSWTNSGNYGVLVMSFSGAAGTISSLQTTTGNGATISQSVTSSAPSLVVTGQTNSGGAVTALTGGTIVDNGAQGGNTWMADGYYAGASSVSVSWSQGSGFYTSIAFSIDPLITIPGNSFPDFIFRKFGVVAYRLIELFGWLAPVRG
jgi:hypothetical protein